MKIYRTKTLRLRASAPLREVFAFSFLHSFPSEYNQHGNVPLSYAGDTGGLAYV